MSAKPTPTFLHFAGAFGAGGLLSIMVLFNGTLATHGSLLFSSFVPHLTGSVAALLALLIFRPRKAEPAAAPVPFWAYLGGVSGGLTVMATSAALNSALALSGTIALGLAGQMAFSMMADARGLFGLPKRRPGLRDLGAIVLICAGTLVLVFYGRNS